MKGSDPAFKLARAWGSLTLEEVQTVLREHGIDSNVESWTRKTTLRAASVLDRERERIIAERAKEEATA